MEKSKTKLTRRERRAAERSGSGAARRQSAQALPPTPGEPARPLAARLRKAAPGLLVLALLIVASYFPALSGGFVWDDAAFAEEPAIRHWSGLGNIWFAPADITNEGHYWPLVYTSFWLEHKLWGLTPLGYHAVNLLLHLVNTVLVWRLLATLAVPGAWAVAAVFAVHPLHVESVAWIMGRKDLLSALFCLGAVLAWMRFSAAPTRRRYGLALGLFAAALLSKSIAVTLPVALLIWHWWQRGGVTAADWRRLAPFCVVGLGITAADFAFYTGREPLALGYTAAERVLIAARALWFYAGKLLWPVELAVIYPRWEVRAGDVVGWVCVAAALGAAVLLWLLRDRIGRGPAAGAAFFAVTLSPVLGFVDYGYMQFSFVADRYQYLAGLGVMALLIGGAAHGVHRLPAALRPGAVGAGALVAVLAVLGTLTWQQAGIYRDGITFFNHVVALNPHARNAHLNLAKALAEAGRVEEAHAAGLVAIERRPDDAKAHTSVGGVLLTMGRLDEVEEHLARALALAPGYLHAWRYMAELWRRQGRHDEAIEAFRKVLVDDPMSALAHAGLGMALLETKRYQEALEAMGRALQLDPASPHAVTLHRFTGRALQALGRNEAAVAHFERAVALDPRNPKALDQLARARFQDRRYQEAVELYRTVLAVLPDNAQAHANLGATLYRLDRPEDALRSFERALFLDPGLETARRGLAQMREALGQGGE